MPLRTWLLAITVVVTVLLVLLVLWLKPSECRNLSRLEQSQKRD